MPEKVGWLKTLSDLDLLTALTWGEARGESLEGMAGVAWVVRNRVEHPAWYGHDWQSVMLKEKQFSCFNPDDPNLFKILEGWQHRRYDPIWRQCKLAAFGTMYGWILDNVHGSNHYCAVTITPSWAKGKEPVKVISRHKFYLL